MMFSTSLQQMSIQEILAGRKHLSFHIQKISLIVYRQEEEAFSLLGSTNILGQPITTIFIVEA